MLSAIDRTCAELTGSGNVATAASIAVFMRSMVSGGNDALEKSSMAQTFSFNGGLRRSAVTYFGELAFCKPAVGASGLLASWRPMVQPAASPSGTYDGALDAP